MGVEGVQTCEEGVGGIVFNLAPVDEVGDDEARTDVDEGDAGIRADEKLAICTTFSGLCWLPR